jgi:hypothetical protein
MTITISFSSETAWVSTINRPLRSPEWADTVATEKLEEILGRDREIPTEEMQ